MLTVDNSHREAPAAFNDTDTLDVSRKITRDEGRSIALTAKMSAPAMFKFCLQMLIGSRSPALVRQGQICRNHQRKTRSTPPDLEEAAGVSGLHARRREAEIRLEAAERNLTRLEDVLGQLNSQSEALKRQARQALRYRTLSQDIRKLESSVVLLTLARPQ